MVVGQGLGVASQQRLQLLEEEAAAVAAAAAGLSYCSRITSFCPFKIHEATDLHE